MDDLSDSSPISLTPTYLNAFPGYTPCYSNIVIEKITQKGNPPTEHEENYSITYVTLQGKIVIVVDTS